MLFRSTLDAGDGAPVTLSGVTDDNAPCFLARRDGALYAMGVDAGDSALTLGGKPGSVSELAPTSIVAVVSAAQPGVVSAVFTDVPGDAYYAPAVQWALNEGVTEGTAPGVFSPEGSCTRAQAVTFLWRAMGNPTPAAPAGGFADVSEDAYYAQAVAWAVGMGIVNGTDETHFSPDMTCSNAHILTMLWRALGEPLKTEEGIWYADALGWARTAGIADGVSVGDACPRRDIVSFLYRALA